MNGRQMLERAIAHADTITNTYLGDLTDAELLVRPCPGSNHIAWQLGHLIAAEQSFTNGLRAGAAPPLPAGFSEKHNKDSAPSDDPSKFCTKAEYLRAYKEQRAATLKLISSLKDDEFDKPAPEQFKNFAPTVADLLLMASVHWLMHAGQWAVTRRKLGRKPLF